ncbi:hypothetical protein NIES2100_23550 [Calothrix sp. NIES-2100]|uniref:hypothetical protein n=1 Tax=Calothrix sp. NIES-2100 TaxID=1954172 RepID=UPI000B5E4F6A|nr:hypothetical protein NIES2100_23550 [Calothrix sp. NIES-2100]
MSLLKAGINVSMILFSVLLPIFSLANASNLKERIHDYSKLIEGQDYIFEPLQGVGGYMTATGKGIKPRDYIILQSAYKNYRYQVEEIEYYADPSDMWIALLKQVVFDQ